MELLRLVRGESARELGSQRGLRRQGHGDHDQESGARGPGQVSRIPRRGSRTRPAAAVQGARETTWKRPLIERGIEADNCYYFEPEKLQQAARAKGKKDLAAIPDPDLAIEVDISPPLADRPGIYEALAVTEVWIFQSGALRIEILGPDRKYVQVDASHYLKIRADEVTRWLIDEDTSDDLAWIECLAAWLCDEWKPEP